MKIVIRKNLNSEALASICLVYLLAINHLRVKADLYTSTDDVLQLNGETFQPTVFQHNKGVTFVVQFYNSFCGHCQTFSPIYKELAKRVKNWTSVIRVAGIDCSKYENVESCSENKIEGYPTIFIFPPNGKFKDPADAPFNLRSLKIEWTVDDIEEAMINYLGNLTQTNRQYPKAIDAMQPIQVDSITQIQRLYPKDSDFDGFLNDQNSQQDLLFIVESDKSFLGRKLIIEYFRIYSKLELRRILLSNKKLLKEILSDNDYIQLKANQPLLLRINALDKGTKAQVLVKGEAEHILPTVEEAERQDFIENRFKTFLNHYYSVELKELTGFDVDAELSKRGESEERRLMTNDIETASKKRQQDELEISYLIHTDPVGSKKIFAQDLLKGISYMITHEIRIKGDIKPKEYNTIRNLLTILKKYLPLDKWDPAMSKFIEDLRTKLDENRVLYDKSGVKSQQMKDILNYSGSDEIRLKYSDTNWISCHESDRQHKGYTCSLWLLFHSLTVGEYVKTAPVRFNPTLVLTTMRDYITKFLGCTVCSSNFARETENLESNLVARNSSVIWLWNTHNHVTQRINNEKPEAQRRLLADIIFPSYNSCQACYATPFNNIGADGKTLNDVEWNMPRVMEFIVNLYRPDLVVSPIELSLLLRTIRGRVNYDLVDGLNRHIPGSYNADLNSSSAEKWNIQSIFSTSDMSICLFLYLSCIMIVAIVCLSLNPKWKRLNKTK